MNLKAGSSARLVVQTLVVLFFTQIGAMMLIAYVFLLISQSSGLVEKALPTHFLGTSATSMIIIGMALTIPGYRDLSED